MPYPKHILLHIDGEWRPAKSGKTIPIINPATEAVLGQLAHAGTTDLDDALAAAEKGFEVWRKTPAPDRYRLMRRAADILRERAETIAQLMTMEQGKALGESRIEAMGAADVIDWYAEEARRSYGRVIPSRFGAGVIQYEVKEPVGPVAGFSPWNFPINTLIRKISGALATGCSIIIKPPEDAPASPAHVVQAFIDAGIPAGVLNMVCGEPSDISAHLIPSPVIRKITFTGSTAVGKHLAAMAGQYMKRATMELGGHGPVIVAKDADIDRAVQLMVGFKYRNAGQVCISPTRFIVEEPVYDEFVEKFVAGAKAVKVGNGLEPDTVMGPLVNERRIEAVSAMINEAVHAGADLLTGGKRIGNVGYFYEPTVLASIPTSTRIMNEEPFGPVALMVRASDLDDALTEANRLPYGLAAYGFTRSAESAARMSNGLCSGMVSINHAGLALPETPFGGINDSGYGTEGGGDALEAYLNTKFVTHLQAL